MAFRGRRGGKFYVKAEGTPYFEGRYNNPPTEKQLGIINAIEKNTPCRFRGEYTSRHAYYFIRKFVK